MSSPLFGTRVRVSDGNTEYFGIMQGTRPDGDITLWDEARDERIYVGPVILLEGAQFTCGHCGRSANRLFSDTEVLTDACADCYRDAARAKPYKPVCEECGAIGNAWRDPVRGTSDGKIKCPRCHGKTGRVFTNRWALSVRESVPLGINERPVCAALHVPGTVQCNGDVRPRGKSAINLCNAHAGIHRTGERR